MYLLSEPHFEIRGSNSFRLASDNRDIDGVFQALERLREIPGMDIPVAPRRKVLNPEIPDLPWISTKIGNIDDDKPFCLFRVDKRKNEVRSAEPGVHNLYRIREFEAGELFRYGRTEPVICKEGIAAPCNHSFRKQHEVHSLDEFLGNYPLVFINDDHVGGT